MTLGFGEAKTVKKQEKQQCFWLFSADCLFAHVAEICPTVQAS